MVTRERVALMAAALALACGGPRVSARRIDAGEDEPPADVGSALPRDAAGQRNQGASVPDATRAPEPDAIPPDSAPPEDSSPPDASTPPDASAPPPPPDAEATPADARPVLPAAAIPAPWTSEDVGLVGIAGGAGQTPGTYQVRGSGADIWGTVDAFHLLHRPVKGDVEIVARLVSQEYVHTDAKAGLMLRESTAPDARNAFMAVLPAKSGGLGKGSRLQFRDKRTDLLTGFVDLASARPPLPDAAPLWLRLVRQGARLTGYVSADGVAWVEDGSVMMPTLPDELLGGLAVCAHGDGDANLAVFDGVRVTAISDAAWAHDQVGMLGGYAAGGPARFTIEGAGAGPAGKADGVSFVHRREQQVGDVELSARITALSQAGSGTARAGLMLRSGLSPDARMLALVVELGPKGQRYSLVKRAYDGAAVTITSMAISAPSPSLQPVWLKLTRVGNGFLGQVSAGSDRNGPFVTVAQVSGFIIPANALVGVAAAAGSDDAVSAATIEDFALAIPPAPTMPPPVDGGP
jgi:hypothetical protein